MFRTLERFYGYPPRLEAGIPWSKGLVFGGVIVDRLEEMDVATSLPKVPPGAATTECSDKDHCVLWIFIECFLD